MSPECSRVVAVRRLRRSGTEAADVRNRKNGVLNDKIGGHDLSALMAEAVVVTMQNGYTRMSETVKNRACRHDRLRGRGRACVNA